MNVISQVVCNRPQYLKRVLESLAQCQNIQNWIMFVNAEPICEESIAMVRAFDACETRVIVNDHLFGPTRNFFEALNRPFLAGAEYVTLAEDDALVANDFLLWHEFAKDKFRDDKSVLTIAGGHYGHKGKCDPNLLGDYDLHGSGLMNKGWGIWRDRWLEPGGMTEKWEDFETLGANGELVRHYKYRGYEGCIEEVHIRPNKRLQVFPIITRVFDIGESGVHCTPEIYEKSVKITDWAGNYDLSGVKFRQYGQA